MVTTVLSLVEAAAARGRAWELPFNAIDPTAADDHFLVMQNDGAKSLAVVEIEITSTVAGNLEPMRASGTPTSGTTIVPASLSGPGGGDPIGTFETGVNLQLTEGETLGHFYLAADTPRDIKVHYVIPAGTGIVFNWESGTGILSGQVTIVELAPDEDPN